MAECSSTELESALLSQQPPPVHSKQYLATLKIWDRRSCFIMGVPDEFLNVDTLSTNQAFGLFGEIQHLRIIHMPTDIPSQVFIKYTTLAAAERAIQWCLETGIAAKHGFQRYCAKHLCGKVCKRRNCPNLHRWARPDEIMDADEAENFAPTKPKAKNSKNKNKAKNKGAHRNRNHSRAKGSANAKSKSPRACQAHAHAHPHPQPQTVGSESDESRMSLDRQGLILQQQYDRLQQQCSQQSLFIHNLIQQLDTLSEEHRELREQNSLLLEQQHSRGDLGDEKRAERSSPETGSSGAMLDLDEMVDNIVDRLRVSSGDSGNGGDSNGDSNGDSSSNRQSSTGTSSGRQRPDYSGGSSEDKSATTDFCVSDSQYGFSTSAGDSGHGSHGFQMGLLYHGGSDGGSTGNQRSSITSVTSITSRGATSASTSSQHSTSN